MEQRYPIYAEADVIVDCGDEPPDHTTTQRAGRAAGVAAGPPAARRAAQHQL